MKRRTSTRPVLVYKYGIPLRTNETPEVVEEQIYHAHRYRNALVAVERNRRAAYRTITGPFGEIPEIEARISAAAEEITQIRTAVTAVAVERRRREKNPQAKTSITKLKQEIAALKERRKAIRASLRDDPEMRAELDAMDERVLAWQKLERAATPTYWGTYLSVEESVKQAAKKATPEFRAWRPYSGKVTVGGSVGVQLQKGLSVAQLHACTHQQARLQPVPEEAYGLRRGERKRASRTTLMVRVGSEGRAPIWARFPIIMHRPLPEDATIKYIRVKRERIGTNFRWEATFTLETDQRTRPLRPPSVSAGVDLGWRRVGDHLKIAHVESETGETDQVLMPMSIVARFDRADSIRSIRTLNWHENLRPALTMWLKSTSSAPEWLRKGLRGMGNWNNPAKMTRLAYRWTDNRFAGDETIFSAVADWLCQDRHLHQIEDNGRKKAALDRREIYRLEAKRVAQKWPRLVVNGLDLSKTARRNKPEDGADPEAPHYYRADAAAGEFREALKQVARSCGTEVVLIEAPAKDCHACGKACVWDAEKQVSHTCEHCGAHWNADANQARKLLAAARGEVKQK